ncbi:hypothetical protein ABZT04_03770 [Streptomyces sp. NPDC005492]|uniref:hypothetical protein n=1 Tax=Streptomyces sp. NPDC005492 TaxID=3156883 RepID=UPI00339E29F7
MLRSVLVAAFSAVVAFGAAGGLSVAKGDVRADSVWAVTTASGAVASGDTSDGTDDSVWA